MSKAIHKPTVWVLYGRILAVCIIISWSVYALLSSYLIEAAYRGDSIGILNMLMQGRAVTPLQDYYEKADRFMVVTSFSTIALFLISAVLVTHPLGVITASLSFLLSFSLIFLFLDFSSLDRSVPLDFINYYAYRAHYLPDDKLVHRDVPLTKMAFPNFRGTRYSPIYKLDVVPTAIQWSTDEDGFRSSHPTALADVIVLGDSFIEYGDNEADIFPKRLERQLPGMTVANLGKSGYGPFQYVEVLKRYGLPKRPRYAIFSFYAGNDLNDIEDYQQWKKKEGHSKYVEVFTALTGNITERYFAALTGVIHYIEEKCVFLVEISRSTIRSMRGFVHPSVAVLNIRGEVYKIVFVDRHREKSALSLLHEQKIRALRDLLDEFKAICQQNDIVPILLYIPTGTQIYAEYSTPKSGSDWLRIRDEQVRQKHYRENAIVTLAHELNLELISLSPAFARAAADGKMLYYALDSHWNAEGREQAAVFVAKRLRDKFLQQLSDKDK